MRRRLLNLLTAMSLFIFVVTALLWHWSYDHVFHIEDLSMRKENGEAVISPYHPSSGAENIAFSRLLVFASLPGKLSLRWSTIETLGVFHASYEVSSMGLSMWFRRLDDTDSDSQRDDLASMEQQIRDAGGWDVWGLALAQMPEHGCGSSSGIRSTVTHVVISHWLVCLLTLPLPLFRAVVVVRRLLRRAHPETCQACGYDLRASPTRCPECGTDREKPQALKAM